MSDVIGVDIGGTHTKVGGMKSHGEFLRGYSFPTKSDRPFSEFSERLLSELAEYCLKNEIDFSETIIGVGCPNYNPKTGMLVSPPNLSWGSFDLQQSLRSAIHPNLHVENDANLAAWGEFSFGGAVEVKDFIVLTLGTGVGSGIFANGKPFLGSTGIGAEAGHIVVGEKNILCGCGGADHLESYSSVTAMKNYVKKNLQLDWDYPEMVEAFVSGDDRMQGCFQYASKYLAAGIASLISMFSPSKVILTGGGLAAGDKYLAMIQSDLDKYLFPNLRGSFALSLSQMPPSQGAVKGAIAFGMHQSKNRQLK